jgi:hypothetical protein
MFVYIFNCLHYDANVCTFRLQQQICKQTWKLGDELAFDASTNNLRNFFPTDDHKHVRPIYSFFINCGRHRLTPLKRIHSYELEIVTPIKIKKCTVPTEC